MRHLKQREKQILCLAASFATTSSTQVKESQSKPVFEPTMKAEDTFRSAVFLSNEIKYLEWRKNRIRP